MLPSLNDDLVARNMPFSSPADAEEAPTLEWAITFISAALAAAVPSRVNAAKRK